MMSEENFAKNITTYLDHGAGSLRAGTVYRLQQARAAALARLEPATASAVAGAPALVGAGGRGRLDRPFRTSPVRWLGVALIVAAAAFGWQQWRAVQQVDELQDLDAQLLSSDLPIDAYLDRGFLNWLRADSDR